MKRIQIGLAALGIFIGVCAFYAQSVRFSFVNFDDSDYVFHNPHTMAGLTDDNVLWAFTDTASTWNWHPLTMLSLMADVSMSGVKAKAIPLGDPNFETPEFNRLSSLMHGHNAVLHAANAALLFLLTVILLRNFKCDDRLGMLLAVAFSVLWAIHPLRAEAVCWVSERKEVLCAFFMLLSLIAYAREATELALFAFFLALLAKPVAVTLPAVFAAYDFLLKKRMRWGVWTVSGLLSAGGCVATVLAQQDGIKTISELGLGHRLINAVAAIGIYVKQTVVPLDLAAMYAMGDAEISWGAFALGAICIAAAGFAAFMYCTGKRKWYVTVLAFTAAWSLLGLLPMLGIVQVGQQTHADRYTYWVGCGVTVAASIALSMMLSRARRQRTVCMIVLVVLTCAVGFLGWRQAGCWRDTRAIYGKTYAVTGGGWAAAAYAQSWKLIDIQESDRVFREAIQKCPSDAFLLSQFAVQLAVRSDAKDFNECVSLAQRALQIDQHCPYAYEALGFVAIRSGAYEMAEAHFRHALEFGSDNPVVQRAYEDARRKLAERQQER